MFEDSLMESTRHLSKRRGWTTLISSGLQVFVLAILVLLPLLHTNALPPQSRTWIWPGPPISAPPSSGSRPATGNTSSGSTRAPMEVPNYDPNRRVVIGPDRVGPSPDNVTQICITNCGTLPPGVPFGTGTESRPVLASQTPNGPAHVSHLDPGQIVVRVEPAYPSLARITRTQGLVTLHAVISRDGTIENLQLVSGHPMLAPAAIDAVKQWRFRPYVLNGQPIEVETEITINFILGS